MSFVGIPQAGSCSSRGAGEPITAGQAVYGTGTATASLVTYLQNRSAR